MGLDSELSPLRDRERARAREMEVQNRLGRKEGRGSEGPGKRGKWGK